MAARVVSPVSVARGLRRWAAGSTTDSAAVELPIGYRNGRHARAGCAWVKPCRAAGWWWVDPERLAEYAVTCTAGGERQLLLLAAAFLIADDPQAPGLPATMRARAA